MTAHDVRAWRRRIIQHRTDVDLSSMPLAERSAQQRYEAIGRIIIPTPQLTAVHASMAATVDSRNPGSIASVPALAISGPATVGKSTAVAQFAMDYERARRAQEDLEPIAGDGLMRDFQDTGASFIPVVRVSAAGGPTQTLRTILNFFLVNPPERMNTASARMQISQLTASCRTELIILEQFDNLASSPAGAQSISEQIKFISEATDGLAVILVGIDIENMTITRNIKAHSILTQFTERLKIHPMQSLNLDADGGVQEFLNLLATWERDLPLLNKEPGDLVKHANWIAEHTQRGATGRLADLLRAAAREAIRNKSERITATELNKAVNPSGTALLVPSLAGATTTKKKPALTGRSSR